ncbi:tellurite resistance/C4-dicarboxylate transporter family protein [Microbacterium sp. KUDC0406]|uniref:tellurite resistance/C4-dicarboxylate transporter family protein n=1 Tax=Microbacterium sp. KUDC0406 TaxID=2909588 RepID=UPI001F36F8F1|nr:tellurite resistance/C4-dicarboxylate transporter family protein [Microbacterium sp. KUDC0406]UJP11573.1 tellurite resistance/C4-dicarboxylate transporter family protein [Microbacterium sp. KUDC0406]
MTSPIRDAVAHLAPGYFALVMGTGIISVGLHDAGWEVPSDILMWIAIVAYAVLWVLYIWRASAFRKHLVADLRDPAKAFGFFTIIAGTDVLAVRLSMAGFGGISLWLLLFAVVLWFVFGYALPWQVLLTRDGKPILARTNGSWFIWAVASQSVAVAVSQLQPLLGGGPWAGMLAVLAWSVGVSLYVAVAILVLLRIVHFGITPQDFDPTFWVTMGALAIAVVAGSGVVDMDHSPMVDAVRPLVAATVAVFWTFCAWLIPALVGAGVWRHFVHRVPLRYEPTLWSMVFPIGMFSVASILVGRVDSLPAVEQIGLIGVAVALVVWAIVFAGMLHHLVLVLWGGLRHRR